jgi:hypothetical protein
VSTPTECHDCAEKDMLRTGKWNVAPGVFEAMIGWLHSL